MQLTDTAAIVTGGASGLGGATTRALAARGARVFALDLPTAVEKADPVDNVSYVAADVTDPEAVQSAVDTATGRIKLKATFANTNDVLWPGQFLQTKLTLRTLKATVVPAQAIQSSQNGDFVFVVKPDSTVQKQLIVAGLTRKGMTVIENGLQPDQTVVIDGQLRLRDGSPVTKSTAPGPQASQMKDRGTP